MEKSEESFDAAHMMCQIRDRLSAHCKERNSSSTSGSVSVANRRRSSLSLAAYPPQRRAGPTKGMELTAYSVRSYLAPAFGSG